MREIGRPSPILADGVTGCTCGVEVERDGVCSHLTRSYELISKFR